MLHFNTADAAKVGEALIWSIWLLNPHPYGLFQATQQNLLTNELNKYTCTDVYA